jgi:signal transduction histidine kinase/ActR/RegA family two-component response regulator
MSASDGTDCESGHPSPGEPDTTQADLRQRLLALVAASGSLLGSPRLQDVLPATLRLAGTLVAADAYAVWRLDAREERWAIASASGLSEQFTSEVLTFHGDQPLAVSSPEPIVAEDVMTRPTLQERREAYAREGLRSMLAIPLLINDRATGTLVFYYRAPHRFSTVEIETARALGNLAAAAIRTAELYEQQQYLLEQAAFLSRAAEALAASVDYQQTLRTLATLAVPRIADWCAIDIATDDPATERLAVAHVDPAKVEMAVEYQKRYPSDPHSPYSAAHVIRTARPVLLHVTDDMLLASARGEEHLAALRALDISSVMIVPLRTRHEVLGAITFVSSSSRRRYREADLQFAETVADRAAIAVENARAHDALQRANRLKDEFLATLSHELRTPLNAVMGYTRMLRQGAVEADRRHRALETVERNAAALAQIVEDVLDISRIVAGKLRLAVEPLQLTGVLEDAVATVLPAAEAKGITVRLDGEPDGAAFIWGDADRLQQVFWNLISNAVKFTASGGSVSVTIERGGPDVHVAVKDTGRGISPAFLPFIFDRFRQGDPRSAREGGGLGLGLSIARNIVEMHGGTIVAESEGEYRGATFRVTLPAARASDQMAPIPLLRPAGRELTTALADLSGLSVLLVDDEADARELMRAALESAGATVTDTASAGEAWDALSRQPYHVLLSDIGMPGVDGIELIRRVREATTPELRAMPAAAVTAFARSDDRVRALRAGYQRHVSKPIDPVELTAIVAWLGRQQVS